MPVISLRDYTTWNIYLVVDMRENQGGPAKSKWGDCCPSTPDPPRQAEGTGLVQFGEEPKSELTAT